MAQGTVTLPGFVSRLEAKLSGDLTGAVVSHEQIRGQRCRFIVVWSGFDGMGHPERQRKVWDAAETELSKSELLNVGMILTLGTEDQPQQ